MAKQNVIKLDTILKKRTLGLPVHGTNWIGSPAYKSLLMFVVSNGKGGTAKIYTEAVSLTCHLNSPDRFLEVEDIDGRNRYVNKETILYAERVSMVSAFIYSKQDNFLLPVGESEIQLFAPEGAEIELQDYDDIDLGTLIKHSKPRQ